MSSIQESPIWLVYSREHNMFWRANACGYTVDIAAAGRYTKAEADRHCNTRGHLDDGSAPEVAVIAPEAASVIDEFTAIADEFCARVERGEVRSKYTYSKLRAALSRAQGEQG